MRSFFSAALLLLLLPGSVLAEERYVTDELSIDLRRERGNEFRILRMLPAGTPVTVLETHDGWSRVRADDIEGWLLSRFLTSEPSARDRLARASATTQRLTRENESLRVEVRESRGSIEGLQGEIERLHDALETLQNEHQSFVAATGEPARLLEENQRLGQQVRELEALTLRQEQENAVLRTDVQRDWLLAGAGVLGSGLFLGLVLPPLLRRRQRRLSSEWM